jgi:hypothetical protein
VAKWSHGSTAVRWVLPSDRLRVRAKYQASGGGPEAFGSNIDTMLNTPGINRRCFLPINTGALTAEADIAVYPDSHRADLAAARDECQSLGGTEDGGQ